MAMATARIRDSVTSSGGILLFLLSTPPFADRESPGSQREAHTLLGSLAT